MACEKGLGVDEDRVQKRKRFADNFLSIYGYWEDAFTYIVDNFAGSNEDIDWALKTALQERKPYVIEQVMKLDTELRVLDDSTSQTAIHIAAKQRQFMALDYLFQYGTIEENLSDKEGFTYLHAACISGHAEIVQKFVDLGVDLNRSCPYDERIESPLTLAIGFEREKVVKLLLENGADPEGIEHWSTSFLHELIENEEFYGKYPSKIVEHFANYHCERLVKHDQTMPHDEFSRKIIRALAKRQFFKAVNFLFQCLRDAELNDDEECTHLHSACMSGNVQLVQKFIDLGAVDLDLVFVKDECERSLLTLAIEYNQAEVVELLLKNGADPDVRVAGKTPLHIVLDEPGFPLKDRNHRDSGIFELLIKYKCDVNAKDDRGRNPLCLMLKFCSSFYHHECDTDIAVEKMSEERHRWEILLRNGANANEVFAKGQTILQLLIRANFCGNYGNWFGDMTTHENRTQRGITIAETLLKYGADVNARDDDGDSPLHLAVFHYNLEMVKILWDGGADGRSIRFSRELAKDTDSLVLADATFQFLRILEFLKSKGFEMKELDDYPVLKHLYDPDESSHPRVSVSTIVTGSLTQVNKYFDRIKEALKADENHDCLLGQCYELVSQYLLSAKIGKMWTTVKMKDCLVQWQLFLKSKLTYPFELEAMKDSIEREIEDMKTIELKDGVSVYDVWISSPEKAYELLKDSEYWLAMISDDFRFKIHETFTVIGGHIMKSLTRKYFTDVGLRYLKPLTRDNLTEKCLEKIIKYLSNEDILCLCQAATTI